jgi:DNA-binding protein H-NS
MPRKTMAQTLTELETLAQSVTADVKEEIPHLERPHVKLQGLIEQIRKQLTKRDFYQARKQEATRKAHADIRQAKATANLVRKSLSEHYGSDNEQLERFAIKPFRGRKRAKKPKVSP